MPYRALVLLVCSANICRSPMAERLLARLIAQAGDQDRLRVASAGTWCSVGEPATPEACQALAEIGLALDDHRSRCLNQQQVDAADLILVMTQAHLQDISLRFLRARDKTHLLSQMAGEMCDVEDPYGGTLEDYRLCRDTLADLLSRGYEQIVRRALGLGRPAKGSGDKNKKARRWWRLSAAAAKGPPDAK
jgi:protein-tyrosine-phosphatase